MPLPSTSGKKRNKGFRIQSSPFMGWLEKESIQMRKWLIICASCLLALIYPCAELHCWDTAGVRSGIWTEASCDGSEYTGTWSGYITNDCHFIGTHQWEHVTGKIDPSTKILSATGTRNNRCGSITMTGTFTRDLLSVSGCFEYSKGGGGTFMGKIEP